MPPQTQPCPSPPPSESHRSIWYLLRGCLSGCLRGYVRGYVRGTRVSTPAVNLLNENPSLVALGKLTHTNPRATHEPTNPQTSPAQPSHPHPPPSARTHEPMNKSSPAQPITIPGQPRSPKSLCITSHDGLHVLCTAPRRFSPYHI